MEKAVIRLILPLAPSTNRLWRVGRGGRMYRAPEYVAWQDECLWMIKQQTKQKIVGPYILHLAAVKPDKRHRDIDNLLKASSDILQKAEIIANDKDCRAIAAEWLPEGPPMLISVYPISLEEKITVWPSNQTIN